MDENAFKRTHRKTNDNPCPFGKAIQRGCGACSRAEKILIAEREVMGCVSPGARIRCKEVLDTLRDRARFTLKLTQLDAPLPYGKEMKIQCGGLLGLNELVNVDATDDLPPADIFLLVEAALQRYNALDQIPYSDIVPHVNRYQTRPQR